MAHSKASYIVKPRIKVIYLENLSVTVRIASYPFMVIGRLTIKSIVYTRQGLSGVLISYNSPKGLRWVILATAYIGHPSIYSLAVASSR